MTQSDTIENLIEDFEFLDDWEDRYRYVIELGKKLPPLAVEEKNSQTKVNGCASQVWLVSHIAPDQTLDFRGESDAHIVQGLVAILLRFYAHKTPQEIIDADAIALFKKLGLDEHLSPQRSNGFASMVNRIRKDAAAQLDKQP